MRETSTGTHHGGLQAEVIRRAWRDQGFKADLVADPRAAVAGLGYDLPADVELKVLEETAETRYLVLPQRPARVASGRLDDADLRSASTTGRTTHSPYRDSDLGPLDCGSGADANYRPS